MITWGELKQMAEMAEVPDDYTVDFMIMKSETVDDVESTLNHEKKRWTVE